MSEIFDYFFMVHQYKSIKMINFQNTALKLMKNKKV